MACSGELQSGPAGLAAVAEGTKMELMKTLKAKVENGRLVMNEPTDLPEGTEIEMLPASEFHDLANMDPSEREALEESLRISEGEILRGETMDAAESVRKLRD